MLKTKWGMSKECRNVWSSLVGVVICILSLFFWWPISIEILNIPQGERTIMDAVFCLVCMVPGPAFIGLIAGLLFRSLIDGLEKLWFKRNIMTNNTLAFVNSLRK